MTNLTKEKLDELERLRNEAPECKSTLSYTDLEKEHAEVFYFAARAAMPQLIEAAREYYQLLEDLDNAPLVKNPPELDVCSFCGKQRNQVENLIHGPNFVTICNECVLQCVDVFVVKTDRERGEG